MFEDAVDYEKYLEAKGRGIFGEVEYEGTKQVVLRVGGTKTSEVSGTVKMYFDAQRREVISGRRFDPMSTSLLRPMTVYKVNTTLHVHGIPEGVQLHVILADDARDVMMLVDSKPIIDESGLLSYLVMPFRRMDIEAYTSPARLMFDVVETVTPKKPTSKKPATKKTTVKQSQGETDAAIVPGEHSNSTKD